MRPCQTPKTLIAGLLAAASLLPSRAHADGRPITVADLLGIERVSDPRLAPDGRRAVYTVSRPDMTSNRLARNVWLVSLADRHPRALTMTGKDSGARWAPDGRRIAFVSSRDGGSQIYLLDVDADSEPLKITGVSGGADNIVWSPDGREIAFTSDVFPDCRDDACNRRRDEEREKSPVHARIYDRLLYRHWTDWSDGKRRHLFIVSASGGPTRDLIPGADYDVPPREREGPRPIAFSPDGKTLCFTAVTDRVEATTTNGDLFEVAISGGSPTRLTTNPGFDDSPEYSPDGGTIAYRSQARPGIESDRWRLMRYNRASRRSTSLTDAFDRSVEALSWSSDGKSIYFNAEDHGEMPLFVIPAVGGAPRTIAPGLFAGEFDVRGTTLLMSRSSLDAPAELFLMSGSTAPEPLTRHNQTLLGALDLPKAESFTFPSVGGEHVQGFLLRPPGFDRSKKYPVLMLLHGGPQTQWSDAWSYRWNAQTFASPGYVVLMINRRGSTGFGQKFTDEITLDWGGRAFEDQMKGLDFVLATYPFTDGRRVGAAGASYGGYMIDWLESHAKGRFRVLVSHAGVYDLTSMYGATEELWFPEHDFGGTPWTNPAAYQKPSPHTYAADFARYKTPTLVIAGEQDFRVPYTQSLEFFTALQRQEVPSKLIVFPDEGHWILKPENSATWYREVLAWLNTYLT